MYWLYDDDGAEYEAVSSRVRLARNLKKTPFPGCADADAETRRVRENVEALTSSAGGAMFFECGLSDKTALVALAEEFAVSPDFVNAKRPRALVRNAEPRDISVMFGEEDHVRIQAFAPGLNPEACYRKAGMVDDFFDERFGWAFDEKLGYLTACPTNLGTGMRASVMLHLPALTKTRRIGGIADSAAKSGLTVRGIYGEGTRAAGYFYQLSNRGSLGLDENGIFSLITGAAKGIISAERQAREELLKQRKLETEDAVFRARGLLQNARKLETGETLDALGDVRMGAAAGLLGISAGTLNGLLVGVHDAQIIASAKCERDDVQQRRAEYVREVLSNV